MTGVNFEVEAAAPVVCGGDEQAEPAGGQLAAVGPRDDRPAAYPRADSASHSTSTSKPSTCTRSPGAATIAGR